MKKVLLLNPPGERLYIRDYFCSKVSQADYLTHPVDFVVLSGILAGEYEVGLIDAIAGKLSPESALEEIRRFAPDAVISLFGSVSLPEDLAFAAKVRAACPGARLVGLGDAFRDGGAKYLGPDSPLDALLLDFTTRDIVSYLEGDHGSAANMLIRDGGEVLPPGTRPAAERYEVPVPRHELFSGYDYRHPFVRSRRFATVLTDYGCPFHCSFCVMGTLGFKSRTPASVMTELEHIKSLGIKEVLFHTQTFGARKEEARELCRRMISAGLGLGWTCFSRVDVADPELLSLMREAGCHTVIFGVESGSDEILKKYGKGYTRGQIISAIDHCAAIGIETVGTFILGLPEETHETMERTLDLLRTIKLDYASINVAVPRMGTPLREEAIAHGLVDGDFAVMDQSGAEVAMGSRTLSREEITKYRKRAVAIFYFNPRYILRRLARIRSFYDLTRQLKQAAALAANTWFGEK
ncbi:MAG: Fe-S oxidoreductase [Elusimicrobia bacterium]|nr:MAG: Fe-S oxidoreductase [Elusimicrobiota bacterium]KAF0157344.1 MAG: Fe-S oxidoreductase [Elusimicrobiota bacterium]